MSQAAKKPIPKEMHSLTAHLICADALGAIEFYKKAFHAGEMYKLIGPNGKLVHASLRIGDSMLMLAEECPDYGSFGPKTLKGSPVVVHLMVEDVDAIVAQAAAAGATVTMPVAEMFWGDRYGQLLDPYGHRWSVATRVRELSPAEIQTAMEQAFAMS
jgi:uncharacterized glyoxalase superfamily protein PhnB